MSAPPSPATSDKRNTRSRNSLTSLRRCRIERGTRPPSTRPGVRLEGLDQTMRARSLDSSSGADTL